MNKKLYIPALASLLMLAGCTADEQDGGNSLVPLSLSAEIQTEEVTRAGTTLLNEFSSGDVLGLNLTNCVNVSGAALATTTYTVGTGFAQQPYISAGQTATVKGYYPSSAASAATFTVSSDQRADGDPAGGTDATRGYKGSDLMFAAAQNATKSSSSPTLTFKHKMAKLIVNVTAVSGVGSITSVTLNNISRTAVWTASSGELGTLSNPGDITMSNNGAVLIPPQTTLEANDFLTIVTSAGTATYKLGKTFAGGSVYTLNINVGLANIGVSTAITGWTGNESSVTVSPTTVIETKLEAVDLGLPSGTKWANMNVGANSETDYGDYFMWGDVAGYGGAVSSGTTAADGYNFNWANYKYCNGSSSTLTKYCNNSSYGNEGFTDALTELEAMDDAATTHMGSPWRMPTATELTELWRTNPDYNADNDYYSDASSKTKIEGYTWTWCDGSTTKYKNTTAVGYKITRTSTGATIFLPAAGFRSDTYVLGQGSYGYYWSSSLHADYPFNAWDLGFLSGGAYMGVNVQYYGYSVRAVQ